MAQINYGHPTAVTPPTASAKDAYKDMHNKYTKAVNNLSWTNHEMNTKLDMLDAAKKAYKDAESYHATINAQYNYNKLAHEMAEQKYWDYKELYDNGEGSAEELEEKRVAMMSAWNTLAITFNDLVSAENAVNTANESMIAAQREYDDAHDKVLNMKNTINEYNDKLSLLTKNEIDQSELEELYDKLSSAMSKKNAAMQNLDEAKVSVNNAKLSLKDAKSNEARSNAEYNYNKLAHEMAEQKYWDYKELYDNGEGSAEELEEKRVAMMSAWNTLYISFSNLAKATTAVSSAQEVLNAAEINYNTAKTKVDNISTLITEYGNKIKSVNVSNTATTTPIGSGSISTNTEANLVDTKSTTLEKNKTANVANIDKYAKILKKIPSINKIPDNNDEKKMLDVYANNLLYPINKQNWYNKVNRYGWIDPYDQDKVLKEFLFFTKPDLSLCGSYGNGSEVHGGVFNSVSLRSDMTNPVIIETSKRMPYVLTQLQSSLTDPDGKINPFMYLLTNAVKSKLDLPAISSDSQETTSNIMGVSMHYRGHSLKADNGYDFSLSFTDTAYLEIYHMVKCYDEYVRMVKTGAIAPFKDHIINRVIPEQFSIYKFLIGSDGETITYYAKLTGCYFTDVPRSDMADPADEIKFSLSFHAQFIEDMNPQILKEFSILSNYARSRSSKKSNNFMNIYNPTTGIVDNKWALYPAIIKAASNSNSSYSKRVARRGVKYDYFLKWV